MDKINCNMIACFCVQFFNGTLSNVATDLVYAHLLRCKNCESVYQKYAKSHNFSFNLKEDAILFVRKLEEEGSILNPHNTKDALETLYGNEAINNYEVSYETYANDFNLEKLLQVKSVKDILNEKYVVERNGEDLAEGVIEFGKYLTKKICKQIDNLERVLKLESKENEKL